MPTAIPKLPSTVKTVVVSQPLICANKNEKISVANPINIHFNFLPISILKFHRYLPLKSAFNAAINKHISNRTLRHISTIAKSPETVNVSH